MGFLRCRLSFHTQRGVCGTFDKTLEMAGRVPGKLKWSPGLNFPSRDLNFPHPLARGIQLAKESWVTWAPVGHFSCHWPSLFFLSLHFLSLCSTYLSISSIPTYSVSTSRLYFLPVSPLLTCLNLLLNTLGLAWAPRPLLVSAPAELAP